MISLAMVAYFQTRGAGVARIAREMALDIAGAKFGSDVVAHMPGVANLAADMLSRHFQPVTVFVTPAEFQKGSSTSRTE